MPGKAKVILIWLLVGFAIYAIITSPDRAADIVQATVDIIINGVQSIGRFFSALLG
jgi:hypothetical protein